MVSTEIGKLGIFNIFLLLFITLQPVIDILTTFSMKFLSESATFGVFFRLLVMLACIIYVFLHEIKKGKSKTLIYLVSFFAIIAVNLIVNILFKENFYFIEEVKYLTKIVYAQIMLFTYMILFNQIRKNAHLLMSLKKYFLWSILIINSVMVISIATGTSLKSYDWTKIGYTGWFFAGNEIGAILAILFPLTLTYAILETKNLKYIYYWIPVFLTGFSLLMLGTKVGYGALFIGLFVSLFICFSNWFLRKDKRRSTFLTNGIISFILFITLIVITPFTPIFSNTFAHLELLGINFDNPDETPGTNKNSNSKNHNNTNKGHIPEVNKEQVENLILSSRDDFLKDHQNQFKTAPIIQKLFGMGYSGNYKETPKMIEMDFYDLFYSLGILGFIVYLLPFLFMLYKIGIFTLKNIKFFFESGYLLFLLSIALGLGISYTAGHVLTAPAVSIYFSIIIAFLFVESKDPLTKIIK
jgi:hypothetical protein